MLATWFSAVRRLITSRSAISAFVQPWARRASTSASRAVSVPVVRIRERRAELAQQRGGGVRVGAGADPLEAAQGKLRLCHGLPRRAASEGARQRELRAGGFER